MAEDGDTTNLSSTRSGGQVSSGDATWVAETLSAQHEGVIDPDTWMVEHGRYQLGAEIARGGGGRVLTARDLRLSRLVAVKLPLDEDASRKRLIREAQLVAQLEHPSIVSMHDLCWDQDGRPFYVMKLLAGETLSERIAGQSFEQRIALLPILIAITEGVAYAHHRGIIHRDLKPSNVIVGEFGETWVIDWGLARASGRGDDETMNVSVSGEGVTVQGTVLGTPAYMAPEQARGEVVDTRADVYGLGALFYHVLTGEAPYHGSTPEEIIGSLLEAPPPLLIDREPRIPVDLAAIVAKAIARSAADRYPTAQELAVDLRAYQDGRLVAAHRYSRWARSLRWSRRHQVPLAAGAAVVAVATAMLIAWPSRELDPQEMCAHAGDRVTALWTKGVRARIADRVRASAGAGATTAAATIGDRLEAYARSLRATRIEACEATAVRGEQSADLLDLRMMCLDSRLAGLGAVIGLFDRVEQGEIEALVHAASELPGLEPCADTRQLRDVQPLPDEPARRAAALATREQLATADALRNAGRFEASLALAREALASPGATAHRPFSARAHYLVGAVLQEQAKLAEAGPELRAAMRQAELAHDDELRADALYRLARNAEEQKHEDQANEWLLDLEAIATRVGSTRNRARGLGLQSRLAARRGDYTAGMELAQRALALCEQNGDELGIADLAFELARQLLNASLYTEAEPYLERARALYDRLLGSAHPSHGRILFRLGIVRLMLRHPAEAEERFRRALDILESAGIHDNQEIFQIRNALASALVEAGRHDEALAEFERLLALEEPVLGPDASPIGTLLYNLGDTQLKAGNARAAEPWFRKAVAHAERYRGVDHPVTAYARWGLAEALLALDQPAPALEQLLRALPVQQAENGPGSDDLSYTHLELARAYLALDRPARALVHAEACQAYFADNPDMAAQGDAGFYLARALHALGRDRDRALARAAWARERYRAAGLSAKAVEVEHLLGELRH